MKREANNPRFFRMSIFIISRNLPPTAMLITYYLTTMQAFLYAHRSVYVVASGRPFSGRGASSCCIQVMQECRQIQQNRNSITSIVYQYQTKAKYAELLKSRRQSQLEFIQVNPLLIKPGQSDIIVGFRNLNSYEEN